MSGQITEILQPDAAGLDRAAALLREGALVAFPTETVYGLGADAANEDAVARIFEAKGRPSRNPLILHFADVSAVRALTEWNDAAEALAEAFWPGPLTMVLPLRTGAPVSPRVTAGQATVAVRLPAAPIARGLLDRVGRPVAAPSANRSGQVSPVRAKHVVDGLGGRIDAVVDGGRCDMGLESTIVGLAGHPVLLRPGGVTQDSLETVLGRALGQRRDTDAISAPGQLRSHYAPRARVRLNAAEWEPNEARLGFGNVAADLNLSPTGNLDEAAANLFEYLIRLDSGDHPVIAVSPVPHRGVGVAINDRLSRAAAER
ncbi:L-threonylcarbamoyladenylate synthase [Cognatishimia sp. F0-27]|uniref:L-threonylcarbamoyladenylate synthase n=1 Tax=Cognatishimia sp. F0-27 TaxID=2816855 RepID=UPI001D0CDAE4|nr:L-threonylcarbamoyladenylate synthase [Cognatishimia sp. F0-27]MCC1494201.1 threonylcarbamoyl-AMP synthase [Cognatishimia sp. F0-27]